MSNPATTKNGITALAAKTECFQLYYESTYCPCAGITAVQKAQRQELPTCMAISPLCANMPTMQLALASGRVVRTGWAFPVNGKICDVHVTNDGHTPIIYLAIEGHFNGSASPYDVGEALLQEDVLHFGIVADAFLKHVSAKSQQWLWGNDWECVPALLLGSSRHRTVLTIHNVFDTCFPFGVRGMQEYRALEQLRPNGTRKTVLEMGLERVDVATTVNRAFAAGLRREPLHVDVLAPHLQRLLPRVVGIDNATFVSLSPVYRQLLDELGMDRKRGQATLLRLRREAVSRLPIEIQTITQDRVLLVAMGRRTSQKLHEVAMGALQRILAEDAACPVALVIATVSGDATSKRRLTSMQAFEAEFPKNVVVLDGRLPYYADLMAAADYNVMTSLFEPHGAAFEGTVVPIARAIDGLAGQIFGQNATGAALRISQPWHPERRANGFLFREQDVEGPTAVADLRALLEGGPTEGNRIFDSMVDALTPVLRDAIDTRRCHLPVYSELVMAALERQRESSWVQVFGAVKALLEQSSTRASA